MENHNIEIERFLEAIRLSVRLNCLCKEGSELMKVVSGTSASGEPANAVVGLRFECPACHHRVGVEVVVQPPKPG
jgi:hypothetical protein